MPETAELSNDSRVRVVGGAKSSHVRVGAGWVGFLSLERGDTLSKIARSHHQSVQSIVRWNNPDEPRQHRGRASTASIRPTARLRQRRRAQQRQRERECFGRAAFRAGRERALFLAGVVDLARVADQRGAVIRGFDGGNQRASTSPLQRARLHRGGGRHSRLRGQRAARLRQSADSR